jgi:uncharacterized ion transporter superfamily protein YfcC
MSKQYSIKVGARAFVLAFAIILVLMVVSGILTRVVPAGSYERVVREGREMVVTGSYEEVPAPAYPVWRWATAPFEVLFAPGNVAVITIILFLIFVGGAFTILEQGKILEHGLRYLVARLGGRRYLLMAIVMLLFMLVAAVLGIYEAMVPLIVFIVPLAHILGWDSMVGLGMSLLPLAFGFSAAITNPFTIGVAQTIADLPLFSGAWLRSIFFVMIYVAVLLFVRRYARRLDADASQSLVYDEDEPLRARYHTAAGIVEGAIAGGEWDENVEGTGAPVSAAPASAGAGRALAPPMRRALVWFASSMGLAIAFILATSRSPLLSDVAFPMMALLLFVGGVGSGLLAGMRGREIAATFGRGVLNISPGIVLILMSMSVKHIVESGGIMDTLLFRASELIQGSPPLVAAFLVYAVTLVMNFFVGSASAKAFLMMPILTPLADLVGITRQTAVLAFGFGDGFSNMIYPSNALLIIALGFTVVSYPTWLRWTIGLQAIVFAISMLFLAGAALIGFGPF